MPVQQVCPLGWHIHPDVHFEHVSPVPHGFARQSPADGFAAHASRHDAPPRTSQQSVQSSRKERLEQTAPSDGGVGGDSAPSALFVAGTFGGWLVWIGASSVTTSSTVAVRVVQARDVREKSAAATSEERTIEPAPSTLCAGA
jgi:hypothetical protein